MMIVGCDFRPSYQQIAFLDTESGEVEERSLTHAGAEAEQFYGLLARPRAGRHGSGREFAMVRGLARTFEA